MTHFNLKTIVAGAAILCMAAGVSAREYRGPKPFDVRQFEERLAQESVQKKGRFAKEAGRDNPTLSFDYIPTYDYMEGPNGEIWFYTVVYDYEDVIYNDYYTERLKQGFTATIYDSSFNVVGTIRDKIRFSEEDAKGFLGPDGVPHGRDVECTVDPTVSRHFFNDDDKYEVMVFHAMNTLNYNNHYYYDVYQIDGEKDEDGNDLPILQMEGRCLEAKDHPTTDGEENFYYTFVDDPRSSELDQFKGNDAAYLEALNKQVYHLRTYTKAGEDGMPVLLFENDVYATALPGQNDGIYFMSKQKDGVLYLAYIQYDKPLFVDPRGGAEDESMTPDTSLRIDIFKTSGNEIVPSSTTKIPVTYYTDDEALIYTFLTCGDVAWTKDIDMDIYGTPEAPAFIITTVVAKAADLDSTSSSVAIYNSNGEVVRSIAEGTSGMTLFDHVSHDGQPVALFLMMDEETESAAFIFKNFYDGKEIVKIDQQNGGDPLYYSCNVLQDENGNLRYVFEMNQYDVDLKGNVYMRLAWFDSDGVLTRIDQVNMGQNVQAAMTNLLADSLDPYLYDDDDAMEYAILVKRTKGDTTRNEFIVVDDDDANFITFSADDGRGDPVNFTVLPGEPNRIMMVYQPNATLFNVDLYDLPFLTKEGASGVEGIAAEEEAAEGAPVYYNLQGQKVVNPDKGIYIVRRGEKTNKVVVK